MRRPAVPGRAARTEPAMIEPGASEQLEVLTADDEVTQPLEPLRLEPRHPVPGVVAPAEAEVEDASSDESSDDASDAPSAQPVTARDVWRATRARRRAQRAEARRFTARTRRKRLTRLGVAGAAVAAIAGVVAIAYSPLFAVHTVTVTGASDELAGGISSALQSSIGTPLASVDLHAVRSTVESFPLVESYQVEARPPHELLVRVVQRSPIGALATDGGYLLVDAAGVHLGVVPSLPPGQALLAIDPEAQPRAFEAAGSAVRALPEGVRAQLSEVRGATGDDTVVYLASGVSIAWGSGDDSALKALVLEQLMAANPQATAFDVSAPGVPVVR